MMKPIFNILSLFYKALIDFVYPPVCLLCNGYIRENEKLVCDSCWSTFSCIDQTNPDNQLAPALIGSRVLKRIVSLWEYNDSVQKVIFEMKYFRKRSLAKRIGSEIGHLVMNDKELSGADFITPVPLHKSKYRERGFNQSALIANVVSETLGIPVKNRVLKRVKNTKTQAKLNAEERRRNVADAFEIDSEFNLDNKFVLILDDVCTTGATIYACSEVLKKNGCKKVVGITAAKTLINETLSA